MSARPQNFKDDTSIIDAVETLSHIADIEFDADIGITEKHDLIVQDKQFTYRTVHWLHREDPEEAVDLIKRTFKVVLSYLRNFYKDEYRKIGNKATLEGVKTIMVLVGEAAKKLDRYTTIFKDTKTRSVTNLPEYKKLQDFYLSKIARKIDEGTLGKWILGLAKQNLGQKETEEETTSTKHIFIDMDSVKRDTEYELFLLRKEDGSRFFHPRLIRNVKLVCDFGDYFKGYAGNDPFLKIPMWQDRVCQMTAISILGSIGEQVNRFYRTGQKEGSKELQAALNKAIMALMMAGNQRNLLRNSPVKSCKAYFHDFQVFLREALHSQEYHKLVTYSSKESLLLDLCNSICYAFFMSPKGYRDLIAPIETVIEKSEDLSKNKIVPINDELLSQYLKRRYAMMEKLIKMHQSGPLTKMIDLLEGGGYLAFDPILQDNIPSQLYSLYLRENKIRNVRIPSPTHQAYIHKAQVTEEFKAFLRMIQQSKGYGKYLLVNMQDRTTWKEHFRSKVLEDLQNIEDFKKAITVVTLPKDTEFYHQLAPYHDDNRIEDFFKHFKEHLQDENSGFYFPDSIRKKIFPNFMNHVLDAIHRIFFSGKNVLRREDRLNFIEIFYLFLELKLIDIVNPSAFSFTCKDGIDIGTSASALLFGFLKLIHKEKLSDIDREEMDLMLYGPSLLIRERLMNPERFNRMLGVLRAVEHLRDEYGVEHFSTIVHEGFSDLFQMPMLNSLLVLPGKAV